jgi:hypothetical protein
MYHEFIASIERGVLCYSNIFLIDGKYSDYFDISEVSLTAQSLPGVKFRAHLNARV